MHEFNNPGQKTWNAPQKFGNTQTKFKGKKTKFNPNVSCTHCMRTGHVRADCYRLIGFLDNFQFTKSNNYHGTVKANARAVGQEIEATTYYPMNNGNQHFSKEQVSN